MGKIDKLWVFVIIQEGMEKIMAWPDSDGREMPLIYLNNQEVMEEVGMKKAMQIYANQYNLYIVLREYQLVPSSEEKFYPSKLNYNA